MSERRDLTMIVVILVVVFLLFILKVDFEQIFNFVFPQIIEETERAKGESLANKSEIFEVFFTNPQKKFDGIYKEGVERTIIEAIEDAELSIDVAAFEFDLKNLADALIAAHLRGVLVRLVYDGEYAGNELEIENLVLSGIPYFEEKRSTLMHNKFVVIDEEAVYTGSFNFTKNASNKNNENLILIKSRKIASNYMLEFQEMFEGKFGVTSPQNTHYPDVNIDGVRIITEFAPEDKVMSQILEVVGESKKNIYFLAFSFTHDNLGDLMIALMEEGIEVSGVFESRGASSKYSECTKLLNAGAGVRIDGNPYTMHHKIIIIDDGRIIITGSFNFSNNADQANDENLLVIYNSNLGPEYLREFKKIMEEGVIPNYECKK